MKRIIILVVTVLPLTIFASQWNSPPVEYNDLSGSVGDYSLGTMYDGDCYIRNGGGYVYLHDYLGNKNWDSSGQEITDLWGVEDATIHPNRTEGFIADDDRVYPVSSSDGVNWNIEAELTTFYRSGHYPTYISCAFGAAGKDLYVKYEDNTLFWSEYPYTEIQEITDLEPLNGVTVNHDGNYIVIVIGGQLYESYGSNNSWSPPSLIPEIPGDDNWVPVLGVLDENNHLLFSTAGSVGGDDIWGISGAPSAIQPTSLGVIKALFE